MKNERAMNQAMERLATGLRINSAADDAAGLAISSKMTSQINGLTQAVRNAQDAMSMLATADGAMIGVTDMIQRMRELSIQAISDTNTDSDRAALNLEYQALKSEIDRIAQNTQWNGRTFFDGVGFSEPATFQIGSEADQTITVNIGTLSTSQLGRVSNSDYMAHASAAPTGDITASTFVSHGSSVPTATNGTSYASHVSAAPTESAYHSEFINHASSAPTTTAGTGYATHASSVPTTAPTSITFNLDSTVAGPSAAATDNVFVSQVSPVAVKTAAVPSGSVAAGGEFQVNTSAMAYNPGASSTASSFSDGGYVIVWTSYDESSGYGIYGQKYDTNGNTLGGEFQINTVATGVPGFTPSVTTLSDGGFVVTWTAVDGSNYGVFGQRYDASGNAAGSEFQVNSYISGGQTNPSVASLKNGGFVVTWESESQDGSGVGVYGQMYNASGNASGAEFKVNTYTNNDQNSPYVHALSDGGFIVGYDSTNTGDGGIGVYFQRFNSSGSAIGTETKANTTSGLQRSGAAIASLPDGGFVIAWEALDQDGSSF